MEQTPDNLPEDLAEKWLNGRITPEEAAIFDRWYESVSEQDVPVEAIDRATFRDAMLEEIKRRRRGPGSKTGRRIPYGWLAAAVAASIIVALGLFWYGGGPDGPVDAQIRLAQRVKPGGNKALLTLANGKTIVLDTARSGMLTRQGNISVTKSDSGLLVYTDNSRGGAPAAGYNTLSTPKGGKYRLVLPDGTKVWLNAVSSIRYPTAFTGDERKVSITGEVYFEVVHNEKMPFRVQAGKVLVEDLGTQFVVNGYEDEPAVKVTLLEGVVKVTARAGAGRDARVLKPGQQAAVGEEGRMRVIENADVQGAAAWKNGLFSFAGSDLKSIMRQLERWYNVSVVYAPGLPAYHFGGQTYMNTDLSEVLKVLELNGIHCKIGKGENGQAAKIYIEP